MNLDAMTLALVAGLPVSWIVAVLTKAHASGRAKATVNAVLAAAVGTAAAYVGAGAESVPWREYVVAAFASYLAAGSAYSHLWKPMGVTPRIAGATASFGIGGGGSSDHENQGDEDSSGLVDALTSGVFSEDDE